MKILPEIKRRKSALVFKEEDVEKEKIDAIIEAARWAPSCANNQSWNYVFVHKTDSTRKNLEDALSIGNGWAKKAPYLVAVGADPDKDCKNNDIPYYAYDAGLSVMNLTIEAEHQGLRVHQMAGWKEEKVKKALEYPGKYRVIVVFAIGYESDVKEIWDRLEEKIKDKLAKPRKRKPLSDNFFFVSFGKVGYNAGA
ncbi:MAG: nitroreductase family protein [Candidatus Methylarchaceae archaeon HK02M2]|nr:nitroreductase family protein [Candidatus Methylarchaceae archaeon HK02M2]